MIQVNQLYITPDNKNLVINAEIVDSTIFKNCYFTEIAICTSDTYIQDHISSEAITITEGVKGERKIYLSIPFGKSTVTATNTVVTKGEDTQEEVKHDVLVMKCDYEELSYTYDTWAEGGYDNMDIENTLKALKSYSGDLSGKTILVYDTADNAYYELQIAKEAGYAGPIDTQDIIGWKELNNTLSDRDLEEVRKVALDTMATVQLWDYPSKTYNTIQGEDKITKVPVYNILDSDDMVFVYFLADGKVTLPEGMDDLPCTWDNREHLEVVCNMNEIWKRSLNYVEEMSQTCVTPNGFTDFILQYNMLKSCLNLGAYNEAIKWWNKFKKIKVGTPITNYNKPCGCHG